MTTEQYNEITQRLATTEQKLSGLVDMTKDIREEMKLLREYFVTKGEMQSSQKLQDREIQENSERITKIYSNLGKFLWIVAGVLITALLSIVVTTPTL